jgi:hypothetical protein
VWVERGIACLVLLLVFTGFFRGLPCAVSESKNSSAKNQIVMAQTASVRVSLYTQLFTQSRLADLTKGGKKTAFILTISLMNTVLSAYLSYCPTQVL